MRITKIEDQSIFPLVIIMFILITFLLDDELILLRPTCLTAAERCPSQSQGNVTPGPRCSRGG